MRVRLAIYFDIEGETEKDIAALADRIVNVGENLPGVFYGTPSDVSDGRVLSPEECVD